MPPKCSLPKEVTSGDIRGFLEKYGELLSNAKYLECNELLSYRENEEFVGEVIEKMGISPNCMSAKYRSEMSFNCLKIDVLKSALQKYIRRNEPEKAVWCMVELDLFGFVAGGTRIRSNLIHRLLVIYLEDVGMGDIGLISRENIVGNDLLMHSTDISRYSYMINSVKAMSTSPHSRMFNHYNALCRKPWMIPDNLSLLQKFKVVGREKRKMSTTELEAEFERCLMKKDTLAFFWVNKITRNEDISYNKRAVTRLFTKILNTYCFDVKNSKGDNPAYTTTEYLNIYRIYRELSNLKEGYLTWFFLISLILGKENPVVLHHKSNLREVENWKEYYYRNLNGERFEIDSYAIDKHTASGRKLGMGKKDFVTEGSYVTDEYFPDEESRQAKQFYDYLIFEEHKNERSGCKISRGPVLPGSRRSPGSREPVNHSSQSPGSRVPVNHGCFSTKYRSEMSFNCFKLDVLKSALQKYIRRGEVEKAVWCMVELDLFGFVDGGSRIRTNLIHRLLVIYLEDVGVANPSMLNYQSVFNLVGNTTLMYSTELERYSYMINAVKEMAASPHSRMFSHYNALCKKPEMIPDGMGLLQKFKTVGREATGSKSKLTEKELAAEFERCLDTKDSLAFYWAYRITRNEDLSYNKRAITKLFTGVLQKRCCPSGSKYRNSKTPGGECRYVDEYTAVYSMYRELVNLKEAQLTWFFLIALLIGKFNPSQTDMNVSEAKWPEYYRKNLDGGKIEIDPYAIDMHTAAGRKSGMGRTAFSTEGSYVAGEYFPDEESKQAKQFYDYLIATEEQTTEERKPEEKEIVVPVKKVVSRKKKETTSPISKRKTTSTSLSFNESHVFTLHARAQLVTSRSKTDTYFAYINEAVHPANVIRDLLVQGGSKMVLVKGPYPSYTVPSKIEEIRKIKEGLGLPYIPFEVIELVPDLLTSPLSVRNQLRKDRSHPFIVFQNVYSDDVVSRVVKRESKLWPPTNVVDWKGASEGSYVSLELLSSTAPGLMKDGENTVLSQYVTWLYFRKIIGASDLADRNFLVSSQSFTNPLSKEVIVYSIDEESFKDEVDVEGELRKNKYKLVSDFAASHRDRYVRLINEWKALLPGLIENIEKVVGSGYKL